MSLFRALTKPLRSLFRRGDELKDELKDKAKDLPATALQTTISGVGQALLIGDQVRSTIKRITTPEGEEAPATTAEEPAAEEERPARREPVIFAPRPSAKGAPEPDGSAPAEEHVSPAPAEKAEWEAPAVEKPAEKPAEKPVEKVAEKVAEKPAPEKARTPEAPAAEKPAAAPAAEPAPEKPATAKPRPKKAAEAAAEAEPTAAPKPRAKKKVAATEAAEGVAHEGGAEPYPGYAGLSLASLRARMRGKSADQMRELIAYEKGTTNRDDVVRMYETRLAKIEAES
ncbi:hypothetical protein [Microtetraspora malaysiensis]|uniref:hypothetical protein n=1 Tax=Microtetraspora malaysiensis TaxID=161358 RepID=UPI00082C773F|nr:hypothetical protein [Microtetraspora malaysiensis]